MYLNTTARREFQTDAARGFVSVGDGAAVAHPLIVNTLRPWMDNQAHCMPHHVPTRWQWLIVAGHIALALLYGAINPPWEAHDETGHFAYVNHVASARGLPDALGGEKVLFDQSHQPPLYYLIVAGLTFWIDRSDDLQPEFNHFALEGSNRRGFRIMLRQPAEAFPWQGTMLALHAARAVSALLTGLAVALIAASANLIFGRGGASALFATAIAGFNPQVIFIGAMVNNDALVTAMGALVAYCLLRMMDARPNAHKPALALGLALGLAFLSKNNALALLGFAGLGLALIAWRMGWPLRRWLTQLALSYSAFAGLALPYLAYNLTRYGRLLVDRNPNNPLLAAPTSVIGEGLLVSLRDAWLPALFVNTFRTFWGKFGWGNVPMAEWTYVAFAIFTVLGLLGCLISLRRSASEVRTALALLAMLAISMMILPLYRALFYQDPALMPGRYLMPALTAYAGLLGFGWAYLITGTRLRTALPVAMGLFALAVPFAYLQPRYQPTLVQAKNVAPLLTFGDLVQLVDAAAHTALLPDREGMRQYARVRLTWRALRAERRHYAFGISVLGRGNEVLGTINVYPNLGNYPSTNWRPGDVFVDSYDILLEKPCARLPALGKLYVAVFPFDPVSADQPPRMGSFAALPVTDREGRPVAPIVGRFKIPEGPQMPVFWQPPIGSFDGIWLREAIVPERIAAGQVLTVALTYELVHPTARRGTAFVHALDAAGRLIAQDDHEPLAGEYPTSLWDPGECFHEVFSLRVPPDFRGALRIATGFYDADGLRFATGRPDDLVTLGEVVVTDVK
jgi:4-amino-4-deoxy-L-arabinose transferase-like glycosyltransferase